MWIGLGSTAEEDEEGGGTKTGSRMVPNVERIDDLDTQKEDSRVPEQETLAGPIDQTKERVHPPAHRAEQRIFLIFIGMIRG